MDFTVTVPDQYVQGFANRFDSKGVASDVIQKQLDYFIKVNLEFVVESDPEVKALQVALDAKIAEKKAAIESTKKG